MLDNVEIEPMDASYILIDCLHHGAVDPSLPPRREGSWQDAPDLPPHPWSDETILQLAGRYRSISEGWRGDPSREFMREMIQRHDSCAMLAWEDGKVVGFLRFYPLTIAQLQAGADREKQPIPGSHALDLAPNPATLWVQCVMVSQPYLVSSSNPTMAQLTPKGEGPDVIRDPSGQLRYRTREDVGARKGVGQKLVKGLIEWAGQHDWKHIVKQAHADLDCMDGSYGGGGKACWEKSGFVVTAASCKSWEHDDD